MDTEEKVSELEKLRKENAELKSVLDDWYIKKCYTCDVYTSRSVFCYYCGVHACEDCKKIQKYTLQPSLFFNKVREENICQECTKSICLICGGSLDYCKKFDHFIYSL